VGYTGRIEYDSSKPDGTPRKLMDVSRLGQAGWHARTPLATGLRQAYADFLASPHVGSSAA
jgi:GDP-L-fucose synthase